MQGLELVLFRDRVRENKIFKIYSGVCFNHGLSYDTTLGSILSGVRGANFAGFVFVAQGADPPPPPPSSTRSEGR
jgi:hypothetical protein